MNLIKRWYDSVSDHPFRGFLFYLLFSVVIWTLQCSLLQNILGLDILETITWGAQGALGHAKHPPLSGWVGYFFSWLSGHSDWSLYLAAQLCLITGVFFVYKTARLWYDEYSSVTAALLLYFLYYYNPSWMKFSTYFLEIAIVPAAAFCFFSALRGGSRWFWCAFGILCGLGILNKYSFGLHLISFAIIFFLKKENLKHLRTPYPWLAAVIGLAVLAPHLNWLIKNDFICFTHVAHRLEESFEWWKVLIIFPIAAYPFAVQSGVLFLSTLRLPGLVREPFRKENFTWCMIFTLVPACVFLTLALSGQSIITMWFCTTFSWTGLAMVSCYPFRIGKRNFGRIYFLLIIYTLCMLTGTTIDLLVTPRPRLHVKPADIIKPVSEFWEKQKCGPIPVVLGERFFACAVENYMPGRPPACEIGDPVFYKRYRDLIREKGALIIGFPDDFALLWKHLKIKPLEPQPVVYPYQAFFGKKKYALFFLIRLKPGYELPQ